MSEHWRGLSVAFFFVFFAFFLGRVTLGGLVSN